MTVPLAVGVVADWQAVLTKGPDRTDPACRGQRTATLPYAVTPEPI